MSVLEHACRDCDGAGHSAIGMWDCFECRGTGVGDSEVRESCRTLIGAARQIAREDVNEWQVNAFWRRMICHAKENKNGNR